MENFNTTHKEIFICPLCAKEFPLIYTTSFSNAVIPYSNNIRYTATTIADTAEIKKHLESHKEEINAD